MSIPSHFEGKIYFLYNTKHGFLAVNDNDCLNDSEEYTLLAEHEVPRIDFDTEALTGKVVDRLQEQIQKERAESSRRVKHLEDRINSLLALEHQEA